MEKNAEACAICQLETEDNLTKVGDKGLNTLLQFCKSRSNAELAGYLNALKANDSPILVHKECRKDFTNARKKSIASDSSTSVPDIASQITRSHVSRFNWRQNCLFCGDRCNIDVKHPDRENNSKAEVISKESMKKICKERNDAWGSGCSASSF